VGAGVGGGVGAVVGRGVGSGVGAIVGRGVGARVGVGVRVAPGEVGDVVPGVPVPAPGAEPPVDPPVVEPFAPPGCAPGTVPGAVTPGDASTGPVPTPLTEAAGATADGDAGKAAGPVAIGADIDRMTTRTSAITSPNPRPTAVCR
jgi:hypothetical protein